MSRRRRRDWRLGGTCVLSTGFVLVVALIATYGLRCLQNGYLCGDVYLLNAPSRRGFDGPASKLERTIIVPTLETPVPAHKNVVWTAAPVLGWRARGERLGQDPQSAAQLDRYLYFGPAAEARTTIAKELPQALPGSVLPAVDDAPGLLSFAYLRINVAFPVRLARNCCSSFHFVDSLGQTTPISFFGSPPFGRHPLQVLYTDNYRWDRWGDSRGGGPVPFRRIVDPSPRSTPYQVVLAAVPLGRSLAATLDDAEARVAAFAAEHDPQDWQYPNGSGVLAVPSLFFRIIDHHTSLDGVEGQQTIELELNQATATNQQEGLATVSEAWVPAPIGFHRPFLVYVRQRGSKEPVIVIWLDNAELVSAPPPVWPSVLRAFW
jgi:hypothetical protein